MDSLVDLLLEDEVVVAVAAAGVLMASVEALSIESFSLVADSFAEEFTKVNIYCSQFGSSKQIASPLLSVALFYYLGFFFRIKITTYRCWLWCNRYA